jgi:hypothetical protein
MAVVSAVGMAALPACSGSTAAPSPLQSQPPSPFAGIVGNYTLTIDLDQKCTNIPQSLRERIYDVALQDEGQFLEVHITDEGFGYLGGDLWPQQNSESRFDFRWNDRFDGAGGCDYPDPTGSTPFYLCGNGTATITGSTLSGVIRGGASLAGGAPAASCTDAEHRFTFIRVTK